MFKNKNLFSIITICLLALIQVSKAQNEVSGTTIRKVPYLVQVWIDGKYACDGVLVSKLHVVTRAHYVHGVDSKKITVKVGVSRISKSAESLDVAKVSVPESYENPPFDQDVAVLTLKTTVKNPNASPIKLCSKPLTLNAKLQVSGWSAVTGESTFVLNTANVKALTSAECKSDDDRDLTKSMFCATAPSLKGVCISYTTGAAVANGELCGIVARNVGCEDRGTTGTYTDMWKVRAFLRGAMKRTRAN